MELDKLESDLIIKIRKLLPCSFKLAHLQCLISKICSLKSSVQDVTVDY